MNKISNKGYTLTEMLLAMAILAVVMVQVTNIMFSTASMYKKGNSEITLQTDAQQVIKMFEELAIDCDKAVSYNSTTKTISIQNKATSTWLQSYDIHLDANNNLYLIVKAADGTVLGNQLMAENVSDIALDMTSFADTSKINLKVSMDNGTYVYESSKDVYLRNHLGSNDAGDGAGFVAGDDNDDLDSVFYDMEILRYKTYDLTTEIPALYKSTYGLTNCTFVPVVQNPSFDPTNAASLRYTPTTDPFVDWYEMEGQTKIKCKSLKNTQVQGNGNAYQLYQSTENKKFLLKCSTVDIAFGTNVYDGDATSGLTLHTVNGKSLSVASIPINSCKNADVPCYVYAQGISLADCKEIEITPMIAMDSEMLRKAIPTNGDGDEYKFYKIKTNSGIINPASEEMDTVFHTVADQPIQDQYRYTDDSIIAPLKKDPIKFSGTGSNGGYSETVMVYLATGYSGGPLDDSDEIVDALRAPNVGKAFGDEYGNPWNGIRTIQFSINTGTMKVDASENALVITAKQMDFSQTSAGILGCETNAWGGIKSPIAAASKFYEMGGEIFFNAAVTFDNLGSSSTYSVKVLAEPVCTQTGHADTCGKGFDSKGQDAFKDAFSSGSEANVEYDDDLGVIYKTGS